MKDTVAEMKNNLQGIRSKADEAENQINNLEYKDGKNPQTQQQKRNRIQKKKK